MHTKKTGFLFILSSVITLQLFAQQPYLQFIENKGQWQQGMMYKAELPNGAFALQQHGGFRVLQYNPNDLNTYLEYYHGHTHNDTMASAAKAKVANPKTGQEASLLRSHCYEVFFLNSNPHPQVIAEKAFQGYNNYFIGNNPAKWAEKCLSYGAVVYKDIYPNIDVRYYTNNGTLKYDLIVKPGGDATQIAMYVAGAEGVSVVQKALNIKTSVGIVEENPPYAYWVTDTGRSNVAAKFSVKGNIVRFDIANANGSSLKTNNHTLVIDPVIVFSTFTGSRTDNWGFTATYDAFGNFYAGGIVFGEGFPTTNGAFQTKYGGGSNTGEERGFDIGIMKFNPTGTAKLYATYIGGTTGNEFPHSLIVDGNNNLVIAGRTSSTDYPTTTPNYGPCGGVYDIIISKLSANGDALAASIKIGGAGNDGVNIANKYPANDPQNIGAISLRRNYGDDSRSEVLVDAANNIYLASCTQSTDFPVTDNAPQKTNGSTNATTDRKQDAVLLKLNPTLSQVLLSTYLGGSGDDAAFVLAIHPKTQHIYVAGATASKDFPGNKTNVLYPAYSGGICDGFVAEFSNDGSTLIRSSYFGTTGNDIIFGIQIDKFGYPYIMGTTTGSWTVTPNVTFKQSGGKQFVSKLSEDLSKWEYSTVFGTNSFSPNLSPTAFLVDRCQNVYVSGWGGVLLHYKDNAGTLGLTPTANGWKRETDGSDFYFIVIERDAKSQLYGTFFGQNGEEVDHVDGGTSRFDRNGIIYQSMCANCGGPASIFYTSPGVVAPVNGALSGAVKGCNLAALKIAFNYAGVGASIQSSINGNIKDTSGCVPLTVDFKDLEALGKMYVWSFGDGTKKDTTTKPQISHVFNTTGTFRVMLVAIDSTTCNIADTSYLNIRVRNDVALLSLQTNKLGSCQSLTYQFNNTSIAPFGKPFDGKSFILYPGDGSSFSTSNGITQYTYPAYGTYKMKLVLNDTNYCNYPDSLERTIRISPQVKANFTYTPSLNCAPATVSFQNTSLGGIDFKWDFGDGTTYEGADPPPHVYANPGNYQVQLSAVDSTTCNIKDAITITIPVSGKPQTQYSFEPITPEANVPVTFTNHTPDGVKFVWDFGDNSDSIVTFKSDTLIKKAFKATNTYKVCLRAYNAAGCDSVYCDNIKAIVNKEIAVANAFSPNGTNQTIKVYGFGITRINWRIFNRWGTLVYQGGNPNEGWDGRYKGVLQPQDVYTYALEVWFGDGSKTFKTGDITLLR